MSKTFTFVCIYTYLRYKNGLLLKINKACYTTAILLFRKTFRKSSVLTYHSPFTESAT